jgi:uncharacterized membrane protein
MNHDEKLYFAFAWSLAALTLGVTFALGYSLWAVIVPPVLILLTAYAGWALL